MKGYKMCWKHEDFKTSSMGPVLRFLCDENGNLYSKKERKLYTKKEAEAICKKFNKQYIKGKKVTHWIKEVNVKQ